MTTSPDFAFCGCAGTYGRKDELLGVLSKFHVRKKPGNTRGESNTFFEVPTTVQSAAAAATVLTIQNGIAKSIAPHLPIHHLLI